MSGHCIKHLPYCLPRSIQSKLDRRAASGRPTCTPRPLGDLNAAMRDLDLGGDEVLHLLEQRVLIGFNIAVAPARRGELRILTRSLEHFRQNEVRAAHDFAWPQIYQLIFPVTVLPFAPYTLTGLELKRGLNCSRGHLQNLAFRYFKTTRPGRAGRGLTPRFTAASVERWLKSRMF